MQQRLGWIIRDRQRFLLTSMAILAGKARISFEGDLVGCKFAELPSVSVVETDVLRRNTVWPKQDFVVVPLEPGSDKQIIGALGGSLPKAVLHIQIEKNGLLQVAMYDQRLASFFDSPLSEMIKAQLQAERVIVRADRS